MSRAYTGPALPFASLSRGDATRGIICSAGLRPALFSGVRLASHADYMRIALDEAEKARDLGEVPVGAVVVQDGLVLSRDHNRRETTADPSGHAEILALRAACAKLGDWRLPGATLYVTLEPCAMCAGAVVLARVGAVVFGASDPAAGAGGSVYDILEDGRLGHAASVIAGVLEEECSALLRDFFTDRR